MVLAARTRVSQNCATCCMLSSYEGLLLVLRSAQAWTTEKGCFSLMSAGYTMLR
jgi:hypothetical protein